MPEVSIIIPVRSEGDYLAKTIESTLEKTNYPDYEFVIAHEDPVDLSKIKSNKTIRLVRTGHQTPGISRNIGSKVALGNILVFVDSHVFPITKNWLSAIVYFLKENPKSVCAPCISVYGNEHTKGYGGGISFPELIIQWMNKKSNKPYEVPLISACCMAVRKDDFFKIGGFHDKFVGWGYEDTELSIRSWLLGYKVFVLPQIDVAHLFKENFQYDVHYKNVDYNLLRTVIEHFSIHRINKITNELRKLRNIDESLEMIRKSDVLERRVELHRRRLYDDDWFFRKFGIEF